ncbi:DUF1365 family protein [Rhizobiales bacterium RZME27]|jgi:DUF1365 family protein|uniref:DUF1365 family protein n=1 Tax=Endobacterium cereale TaxID=2663029 RepID=A0A6A8AAT2_9HYPH|nr:DUF1365 family protein [Endobacterium cereale]MEB2844449.1 DUF1365 family protein [Endobacterium cereale]MQY47038.1 DUF1365 family protein [Endobacterium cereale]
MSAVLKSALFPGHVTHARLKPKEHKLAYRIYSLLLDLDELGELDRKLKLFSIDRFNLFSFCRKERGDRSGSDLKIQVERSMRAVGVEPDGGPIRLLTMPRLLGWAFNPLSVFFCYGHDENLRAILWEVDNTFGERHGYMIPVEGDGGEIVQHCNKTFYVSPFMDMDLRYTFRVQPPTEKLSIRIETFDADGPVLTARHLAKRTELTDAALLKAFFAIPFLTLRVVGGIHWEALKIWLKGVGLRIRPKPPAVPVSYVLRAPSNRNSSPSKVEMNEPV